MRKNKRYRHWIIRNADILERKESGTVRRRKKKRIMIGEKVIGAGFFLFLFMGSALDGPEWKIPLVGAIIGVAIMKAMEILEEVKSEEEESYDNLPDNFRDGDRGEEMQNYIEMLDETYGYLDDANSVIEQI